MNLFDDIERADASGPPHHRSEFAFLNTTAIPMAGRLRNLLEEAFAAYSGKKEPLFDRLRSSDNTTHVAAVFELLLHELARRRQLQPEADSPLGGGLPDQRILLPSGEHAFIEARMLAPGNHRLYDALCDTIDAVQRVDVLYYLRLRKLPTQSIGAKRLRAEIREHMEALDLGALSSEAVENTKHAFVIKDDDRPIIDVIPYLARGSEGGIGILDGTPGDFSSADELRRGLERKNKKYRDAGAPYIIAICSAKGYATDKRVEEALFREGSGEHRGFFIRSPRANVSAVLACQRFKPSAFNPRFQLYLNPNAARPVRCNPFGCDLIERVDGELVRTEGRSFQALMGLPPGWPAR